MNRGFSIVHHLLNAKKRHGVHSPFIYSLTDNGFSLKMNEEEKKKVAHYRDFLLHTTEILSLENIGAGSKKKGNERSVAAIYRLSSSKKKYGTRLFQLARHFQVKTVLELGSNLAWGTYHLHLGAPQAKIVSVEGDKSIFTFNKKHFPSHENIQFHHALFDDFIDSLEPQQFDLVFIDGDHKGSSLLRYIEKLLPFTHNDTLWLIDDIRWSDDMWQTWNDLVKDKTWHVSIDLLRMGILVQRKQQEKEHFLIRH